MAQIDFGSLTQAEQANAIQPRHVFPLIAVGRTTDTGDLHFPARLFGKEKKEVHKIPYSAALLTGPCTLWPMFMAHLPSTSLVCLRVALPAIKVGTWKEWAVWFVNIYTAWSGDERVLWQSHVCDYIPDPGLQRYLKEMPHEEFVRVVTGEQTMTHKHKLRDPLLWYSLYCQWAAAHNLLPIGALVPDNDDSAFDECPLKAADWSKIISAQMKEWKVELSRSPSTTAPIESWRRHPDLPTSLLPSDKAPSEDAFQCILDDVQYYPDSLMRAATDSLRELLLSAKVDTKQDRSIETAKQAPQLHAGLKLLLSRQSAAVRKVLLPQLTKWNDLCIKTGPPVVQAADRVAFMKQFRELVQSDPRKTEWYDVAAHMVFADLQIPDRCDGFAEVSDAKTLLRIACQVAQFGKSKSAMRAVLKELTTALGATPPEASTELPQTDLDKYWQEPLFGDSSPSSSEPPASVTS